MLEGYMILADAIRKYNGISLGHMTRLLNSGTLEGQKIGSQWVVKEESLRNWLISKGKLQPEQAEAGARAEA